MFERCKRSIALLQARNLHKQGENAAAMDCYRRLWEQSGSRDQTGLTAGVELSVLLYQQGMAEEAEKCLLTLLPGAEAVTPLRKKAIYLVKISEILTMACLDQNKTEEAEAYLQTGEDWLDDCRSREMEREYYHTCAVFFEKTGNREGALRAAAALSEYGGADQTLTWLLNREEGTAADRMRDAYQTMDAVLGPEAAGALSGLYLSLGEPQKAVQFALQALSLSQKKYGENSRETADAYIQVAEGCLADGLRTEETLQPGQEPEFYQGNMALNYLHRADNILKGLKTEEPERLSLVYRRLAVMYDYAEEPDKAMQYGRDAMLLASQSFAPDHPAVLEALNQLAMLYYDYGQYRKAYSYSEEVLKRKRATASAEELTEYLWTDILIGLACGEQLDPAKLRDLMTALEQEPNTVAWLPQEALRLQYLRQMKSQREFCYQAALHSPSDYTPEELYDFTLKTNNVDAQISYTQARFFRHEAADAVRQASRQVRQCRQNLDQYLKDGGADAMRLHRLNREVEEAQVHLLKQMGGAALPDAGISASLEEVQAALSEQEGILEYGRFLWTEDLKAYQKEQGSDHYFGFCVTKHSVRFLDLGAAEETDRLVRELQNAVEQEEACGPWLEQLCGLLAAPFETELRDMQDLIVVPDSTLYKLPFELLTDGSGSSLGDRFATIRYLSSGREILNAGQNTAPRDAWIDLIAAPEFDLTEDEKQPGEAPGEHQRSVDTGTYLRADGIRQLPFTKVEAEEVAELFGDRSQLFMGEQATKHILEQPAHAQILHISTHGFAYEAQAAPAADVRKPWNRGRGLQQAEDPLLRCGLLFAGVCNWLRGEPLSDRYGDGILSGNDILTMDLSAYRLLILSACQTGLGQTQSGEGIKGLRHAFELAGVGTMLCTLWEVDDFSSALLMRKFYEELLADPAGGAAGALQRAKEFVRTVNGAKLMEMGWQEHIIELHTLGYQTKSGENFATWLMTQEHPFAHPRYWAGYILQG